MKKFAVKGLIVLVSVVLICVFFSGTFHYITTAKVRLTKAKTGKLESEIPMTGSLVWPVAENFYVPGMKSDDSLVILRFAVSLGSYVKAGDLIAVCEMSDSGREDTLRNSYDEKEKEYLELERKNSMLQLTPQQKDWYTAYQALKAARRAEQTARQEFRVSAWRSGVELNNRDELPEGTDDEALKTALEELNRAMEESEKAQASFDDLNHLSISEDIVTYLEKKAELETELASLANSMTELSILKEQAAAVTAPHDGYISSLELKAGDTVSRSTPLVQITEEGGSPVIRLDPGENRRNISPGLEAELSAGSRTITSAVTALSVTADGKPAVDVQLKKEDLSSLGGAAALTEAGSVSAKIKWKADAATTLIPTSALRGSEGDYYIFVAQSPDGEETKRAEKYRISRKNVNVLGQSGTVTSIEETLKFENIVYMEDRELEDGCEVMPYDET